MTLLGKPVNKSERAFQLIQWLFLDTLKNTGSSEIPQQLASAKDA